LQQRCRFGQHISHVATYTPAVMVLAEEFLYEVMYCLACSTDSGFSRILPWYVTTLHSRQREE
jgi:hypothetical protein